jgi:MYXO-CTERM domain-containing protein
VVKIHHTALGAHRTRGLFPPTPIVDVGTRAHADSFTLIIGGVGAAAVPEPSGLSQLGVGLAGLMLAGIWRRRRRT